MTERACPLCGGAAVTAWFEKAGCVVCRCAACTLVFTAGDWSAARARAFYGAAYFAGHDVIGYSNYAALESALRATAARRLRRLPTGARLLDLGCGPGVFAAAAQSHCRTIGSDVSSVACQRAHRRGVPAVVHDATSLPFVAESYDVVTMWDTLEHLATPLATLREVGRVLRPGGLLVLSTGDVTSWCARLSGRYWHLFTLPEHRYFYSLATLDRVLEAGGLQRRAAYHDGAYYSLAYLLERLVKSFGGTTHRLDAVLRYAWLNRARLCVNLFDIMTVEAVKPLA